MLKLKALNASIMKEHELGRFLTDFIVCICCLWSNADEERLTNTKGCRSFIVSLSMASMFFHQHNLCWVATSITKQKVDKRESLMLAKLLLDYQCTEEEASSVYSKMRSLKRMYLNRDSLLAEEDFSRGLSNVNGGELQCSSYKEEIMHLEFGEKSADKEHATQQKLALKDTGASVQKKCEKWMKKLMRKHREQIQQLLQIWEDKKDELERDWKLRLAVIRSIHGQTSARIDKLKVLNDDFKKRIDDHHILKNAQLAELEAEHLIAINEERQKAADWLAKAKASSSELRVVNGHQSFTSQSDDDAGGPQLRTSIDVGGDGINYLCLVSLWRTKIQIRVFLDKTMMQFPPFHP